MVWACVSEFWIEGKRGVLSCVKTRGKTNILHHVPSHTFSHWFQLFKSCCQCCLSASLSLCLGLRELLSSFLNTGTLQRDYFRIERDQKSWYNEYICRTVTLLVDNCQCEMLLCLNILLLLLLQPALSSPVQLTTPSRGCATCKSKSTQRQPVVALNATALAIGEACGVYTLSCAQGLRCAPSEDEPRPLRALLEGRGVCSNASSTSPTESVPTVGKTRFKKVRFMVYGFHQHWPFAD